MHVYDEIYIDGDDDCSFVHPDIRQQVKQNGPSFHVFPALISTKEVMFSSLFVCRICVCVQNISKSYKRILMTFSRKNAYVMLGPNPLAFGEDPDSGFYRRFWIIFQNLYHWQYYLS